MFNPQVLELSHARLFKWHLAPRKARFVHIGGTSVFMRRFTRLVEKSFDPAEHLFLLLAARNTAALAGTDNWPDNALCIAANSLELAGTRDILRQAEKIFIHSLWHDSIMDLLISEPASLPKTDWVVWGGDLYEHPATPKKIALVQSLHGIIAHTPTDWNLAREKFGCQVPWTGWGPFYESGEMAELCQKPEPAPRRVQPNVLVGHSASRHLEHEKIFRILERRFPGAINVYSVLSYGDGGYAAQVMTAGQRIFGPRFHGITKFMPARDYYSFLKRMDIGIFANLRSQGLGNATALLHLGKKVFVRHGAATHEFLEMLGADTANVGDIEQLDFDAFTSNPNAERNHRAMLGLKSGELATREWRKILYGTPLPKDESPLPPALRDYIESPKKVPETAFWAQVRRTRHGKAFPPEQLELIFRSIADNLRFDKNDFLLDLACGNGKLASEFFQDIKGYQGVDLSPALIEIAKKNFKCDKAAFVESDIESYLEKEENPSRFTKCLFYGSAAYFSIQSLHHILHLLNLKFKNIALAYIGPIPDKARATDFFHEPGHDLNDQYSEIGLWHYRKNFKKMAQTCGWEAEIKDLPTQSWQHGHRFIAILARDGASCQPASRHYPPQEP